MGVEEFIPYGRENAIPRKTLARIVGTSDRTLRKMIELARENGKIIINLQNGTGYYRINTEFQQIRLEDIDDIYHQYNINQSRAMKLLVQQKHLRRILKQAGKL